MTLESLRDKAKAFRSAHQGAVLVLPNAWDAGSAVLIERAGAPAIATTSGGVSWALGHGDGQRLMRADMVAAVRRIAAAVTVPVTADIEGGYGPAPADVAATVSAIVEAGAAGVNLEDSIAGTLTLFDVPVQAERLRAARAAAEAAGLPELVINARTDVYLFGVGASAGRLNDVLARATAYAAAGADYLFVPGLVDLELVRELTAAAPIPVAAMAGPGAPSVAELATAGVRWITVGTAIAQAAYTLAERAAVEMLTKGTYTELEQSLDFGTLNALFGR